VGGALFFWNSIMGSGIWAPKLRCARNPRADPFPGIKKSKVPPPPPHPKRVPAGGTLCVHLDTNVGQAMLSRRTNTLQSVLKQLMIKNAAAKKEYKKNTTLLRAARLRAPLFSTSLFLCQESVGSVPPGSRQRVKRPFRKAHDNLCPTSHGLAAPCTVCGKSAITRTCALAGNKHGRQEKRNDTMRASNLNQAARAFFFVLFFNFCPFFFVLRFFISRYVLFVFLYFPPALVGTAYLFHGQLMCRPAVPDTFLLKQTENCVLVWRWHPAIK